MYNEWSTLIDIGSAYDLEPIINHVYHTVEGIKPIEMYNW